MGGSRQLVFEPWQAPPGPGAAPGRVLRRMYHAAKWGHRGLLRVAGQLLGPRSGGAAPTGISGRRRWVAERAAFIMTGMRPDARHYSGSATHCQPRVSSCTARTRNVPAPSDNSATMRISWR